MKLLLLMLKLFSQKKFQREFEVKEKTLKVLRCGGTFNAQ